MITTLSITSIVIIVAIGSFIKGISGFGFALVASPLMILILPAEIAIPLIAMLVLINELFLLSRLRKFVQIQKIGPIMISALVGVPIGAIVLPNDSLLLPTLISVGLIALTLFLWRGYSLKKTSTITRAIVGLFGGLMHGMATLGSPFIVLLLEAEQLKKEVFRANLVLYTTALTVLAVSIHIYNGRYTQDVIITGLYLAPVVLIGAWLGNRVAGKANQELFNRIVLSIVLTASVFILLKTIVTS